MPKRKAADPKENKRIDILTRGGSNKLRSHIREFSIQLLKNSQTSVGGFVSYPYEDDNKTIRLGYCVFACFALETVEEYEVSRKFYSWALDNLRKNKDKINDIVERVREGVVPPENELLTCVFNPDGSKLQGSVCHSLGDYGALLWGLVEHVHRSGDEFMIEEYSGEIDSLIDYLKSLWKFPSRDFWGANPDKLHASTLAQVAGGLNWINAYLMRKDVDEASNEIQSFLWSRFVDDDHLASSYDVLKDQASGLDATILLLASPFQVVASEDPLLKKTANLIERSVLEGGEELGEKTDTMRVIPTALLLALYYKSAKKNEEVEKFLEWVETKAVGNEILTEFGGEVKLARAGTSSMNVKKPSPSVLSHALYLMASSKR